MDADGSNQQRLTHDDNANSWYASLAPDGKSVVFSSNRSGSHEIYEMALDGGPARLTSLGECYAPEVSPNGDYIVFTNASGPYSSIWLMNRDGSDPHPVYQSNGADAVDPTWGPDNRRILFALGEADNKRLYSIDVDGTGLDLVNDSLATCGRSDWSPDGSKIAGYSGHAWERRIETMNYDGSGLTVLYSEGNAQAPSFSPDSGWLAFTAYIDNMGNDDGCEIYVFGLLDGQLVRLTKNSYCDWQPRWGP
jgi:Tol biopolymer transport system component